MINYNIINNNNKEDSFFNLHTRNSHLPVVISSSCVLDGRRQRKAILSSFTVRSRQQRLDEKVHKTQKVR